jgi:hypothetical protein
MTANRPEPTEQPAMLTRIAARAIDYVVLGAAGGALGTVTGSASVGSPRRRCSCSCTSCWPTRARAPRLARQPSGSACRTRTARRQPCAQPSRASGSWCWAHCRSWGPCSRWQPGSPCLSRSAPAPMVAACTIGSRAEREWCGAHADAWAEEPGTARAKGAASRGHDGQPRPHDGDELSCANSGAALPSRSANRALALGRSRDDRC